MQRIGDFTEDAFEKGQQVAKQSVKAVAQTVTSQFKSATPSANTPSDAPKVPDAAGDDTNQQSGSELSQLEQAAKQQTQTPQTHANGQNPKPKSDPHAKSPDELNQIEAVRKKLWHELHMETYYNPTFNRPNAPEEHAAEKVEREKQEELMELQEKQAQKPPDIALSRAQHSAEMNRGASG